MCGERGSVVKSMRRRIIVVGVWIVILIGIVAAIKLEAIDKKRVRDVSYEMVLPENIPEEIMGELQGFGKDVCRCSYICSDSLYIVVYYGEQVTDGYSVEINQLYESSNAIFVETTLKGPASYKDVKEEESYPYVVLKLKHSDKKVVFV